MEIHDEDAGLGDCHQVLLVDLQDPVHPLEAEGDAAVHRVGAAAEPRPRPLGRDWYPLLVGESHDG